MSLHYLPTFQPVDLIGFPMDLGADRRGVDMGPSALRIACLQFRLSQLGYRVTDRGDIPIEIRERQVIENPKLKYLSEIVAKAELLAAMVFDALAGGRFPLCIGGDHSIALGSIAGVSAFCRQQGITPGLIWIDAHADMNTEETTPSGNIHGMSLAAALGFGNEKITGLRGFAPKLQPEHCVILAARSLDPGEKQLIRHTGIQVYTMTEIDRRGMAAVIDEALGRLRSKVGHIHVSLDLDSVDPAFAGGVGTPVPGGLSYREAHLLMETIADCGCMNSLELAEINPILDHRNQSAALAVELVASGMGARIL